MKMCTSFLKHGLAALVIAAAVAPAARADEAPKPDWMYRNIGPYVGGGLGYNKVDDQTLDFSGTSTSVRQPTDVYELPQNPNSGTAAVNSYKDDYFYNALVGYSYGNGFRIEFELSERSNKIDDISYPDPGQGTPPASDNIKIKTTSGMFNLWYDLFPSWRLHPYVGGGVGISRFILNKQQTNQLSHGPYAPNPNAGPLVCNYQDCSGPRKADDAALAYQLGAGVRWDMTNTITLGLDYRRLATNTADFYPYKDQQLTHLDTDYKAESLMLSAVYYFAVPAKPAPPAAPEPVAVVAAAAACSDGKDNDGDGRIDYPDDSGCASAEDGDETNPPACSDGIDNDGDGLTDYPQDKGCSAADDTDELDPCKTPEPGEAISLAGCGTGDVIVLQGVNFDTNKATLTANAKAILDPVAAQLLEYTQVEVEISGYTDSRGSDAYNQQLSERRAASVVDYLAAQGVERSRMSSVGRGEAQPIADNETEEGRERNRRVELSITAGVGGAGQPAAAQSSDAAPQSADASPAAADDATGDTEAPAASAPADTDDGGGDMDWLKSL